MDNTNNTSEVLETLNYLWSKKAIVLAITILLSSLSYIFSSTIDDYFISEARVTPSERAQVPQSNTESILGNLTSFGMMNQKEEVLKAQEVLYSRDFFRLLLSFDDFRSLFFKENNIFSPDSAKEPRLSPNEFQYFHAEFKRFLQFRGDLNSSYITLSYRSNSPSSARDILLIIIKTLNDEARQKDLKRSAASIQYLTEKLSLNNNRDVRESISNLIEYQLKEQMLANMNDEYLLEFIDTPNLPGSKSGPLRAFIVLISIIVGIAFSLSGLILVKSFSR